MSKSVIPPASTTNHLHDTADAASRHLSTSSTFLQLQGNDQSALHKWLFVMQEKARKEEKEEEQRRALAEARAAAMLIAKQIEAVRELQREWEKNAHKYSRATRDSVDGYLEYMALPGHSVSSITISSRPVDKKALMAWAEAQDKYRAENPGAEVTLASPFKGASYVNSGFGHRCADGCSGMHAGVDMLPKDGDRTLIAPADGTILASGFNNGGFGNMVLIGLDDGRQVLMAHMTGENMPAVGTRIKRGEQVGVMGATGKVTGAHLHMEVRVGNQAVPPVVLGQKLNKGDGVPGQGTTTEASSATQEPPFKKAAITIPDKLPAIAHTKIADGDGPTAPPRNITAQKAPERAASPTLT